MKRDPFGERWYENPERYYEYCGLPLVKCPLDLAAYHLILAHTRPTLVVETGTYMGASALWLAHQMDVLDIDGKVISIDIVDRGQLPEHPKVDFWVTRSSTDQITVSKVRAESENQRVMVILDSDHNKTHVLQELDRYHRLVSKGCYLIVEDTNPLAYREMWVSGYIDGQKAGPAEAVKAFQPTNKGFIVDREIEPIFSQNPNGYLRKV